MAARRNRAHSTRARRLVGVVVACAIVGSLLACSSHRDSEPRASARPNIVFILTDDLDAALLTQNSDDFPNIDRLVQSGTSFSNYFVSDSLCCPSRATTLRGHTTTTPECSATAHRTAASSGSIRARRALDDRDVAPGRRYATGLFGKYFNGYPNTVAPSYVPPGWDSWASPSRGTPYAELGYTLNIDGHQKRYGNAAADYLVDVLAGARSNSSAVRPVTGRSSRTSRRSCRTTRRHRRRATPSRTQTSRCRGPFVRRARRQRQAGVLAPSEANHTGRDHLDATLYRRRVASMRAVDDLVGAWSAHSRARPALQHLHRVHVRQRLPMGQHGSRGQAHRVRGGHPCAAHRRGPSVPRDARLTRWCSIQTSHPHSLRSRACARRASSTAIVRAVARDSAVTWKRKSF